jgi:ABC-type multidrug transport system permease subunit
MYRVSPFTYLVSAMLSTGVSGTNAVCEAVELLHFDPPSNLTCKDYMADYMSTRGGYLENPAATSDCAFCTISSTDTFLGAVSSHYKDAWRNFGIMWAFIIFNIFAAVFIYWLARVPKGKRTKG